MVKSNSSDFLPVMKFAGNHEIERVKTTLVKQNTNDDENKPIINFNKNEKGNKECNVYYNIDYTIPDASRPEDYVQPNPEISLRQELYTRQAKGDK